MSTFSYVLDILHILHQTLSPDEDINYGEMLGVGVCCTGAQVLLTGVKEK